VVRDCVKRFSSDVKARSFPSSDESFR
jgi:ketopantoate hydroxymethyltransferase